MGLVYWLIFNCRKLPICRVQLEKANLGRIFRSPTHGCRIPNVTSYTCGNNESLSANVLALLLQVYITRVACFLAGNLYFSFFTERTLPNGASAMDDSGYGKPLWPSGKNDFHTATSLICISH